MSRGKDERQTSITAAGPQTSSVGKDAASEVLVSAICPSVQTVRGVAAALSALSVAGVLPVMFSVA